MTFEQAEALLAPARRAAIARAVCGEGVWPETLDEADRTFAFGLSTYLEYEDRASAEAYWKCLSDQEGRQN